MTHPIPTMPTREALEAARKHFAGGAVSQAIDACLSAWPAENAVEAGAFAIAFLRHPTASHPQPLDHEWAAVALLAAGLHTSARVAELEAENARLRATLKPFAEQVKTWVGDSDFPVWIASNTGEDRGPDGLTLGHLFAARDALEPRT